MALRETQTPKTPKLQLRGVVKDYPGFRAVDDVSIEIEQGELIALLGPSGCGKTTTLRMAAGFVTPTQGTIAIDGRDVTRLPPYKRDTGMVFQSYALFPHLTVEQNMLFGLKRRGVPGPEAHERVSKLAEMLKLSALLDRLPKQLSGGQQQRVAVGRALVINPAVLLLDEPFSNLDAQLRDSTRSELRRVQQTLGLTSLFVTHDQSEAMAISDRVAVMNAGRLIQIDTPERLYARPATRFVANFIGRANLIDAEKIGMSADGSQSIMRGQGGLMLSLPSTSPDRGSVVLRPEAIRLGESGSDDATNVSPAVVRVITFLGASAQLLLELEGGLAITAEIRGSEAAGLDVGSKVSASWDATDLSCVTE
ncbi:Spermidine/putrescine import ATP-binding protein PotA [Hyphomicrobiales bacterium]|nr:Spermidine/putrescine import ATP-binding protein PotA [Hyphomicrobiales bacterium]CAH1691074.1 Spermidine/putrescine import ATP-binding protein PotA [Hyphomicrobiales bacterium]